VRPGSIAVNPTIVRTSLDECDTIRFEQTVSDVKGETVSDSTSWASPGWRPDDQEGSRPAGDTAPGATPGASGTTSPGGYAPAGGAPVPPPAPGWTPPPKPGLIPLRPLDFGALLGASFQVLRRNPRPTFGAALLLNALVVIVAFGLTFGVMFWALDRASRASTADADAIVAGTLGLVIVMSILAIAISLVAQALLQGVIVLEVSRATVGEKLTLRQLLELGRGRWWALIGWTMILSGALIIGMTLFFIVIVLMVAIGSVAGEMVGAVAAILLTVFGGLGFVALSCWLWIKLAFVPTAIMLERLPLSRAIGRAWSLVKGHFWRTFGILLLITVMVQVASSVVSAPFSIAASFGGVLANPAGDELTSLWVLLGANVLTIAVTVVVGAIGAVLLSAATALIYLDLRMRKEGLDLELQRFVELRASGATAPDPYQPAAR